MPLVDDLRTLADDLREASTDLSGTEPALSAALLIDAAVTDQTADQIELQTYYVAQLEDQADLLDDVEADWFDTSWISRREITLDNAGGAAKTDHPVNVTLSTSNFPVFDNVLAGGADIRFTSENGTTLISHWIESWDDDEETASLWVKVPTIDADTTATIYMYYQNSAALSASNIESTFLASVNFTDTAKLESAVDSESQVYLWNRSGLAEISPIVDISDITNAQSFREQDDIVYDPNDPNLEDFPERLYKFYFTAVVSGQSKTYVAFSENGVGWGDYTLTNITNGRQDPSIVTKLAAPGEVYRDGDDLMYVYLEASSDVDVWSSTDGITWTLVGADAIARGGVGTWEAVLVGSPNARHDGTNFIVGYEGIAADNTEGFGTAVGTDPETLTKNAANPLFEAGDHPALSGTALDSVVVDAWFLNDAKDRIIFTGHTTSTTRAIWRAYTENLDPTTWDGTSILPLTETQVDVGIRNDLTIDNASAGRRIITTSLDDEQVLFYNVSSADAEWSVVRNALTGSTNVNAELSDVDIQDSFLTLTPFDPTSQNFHLGVYKTSDFGVASNFEIMVRAKQEAQTGDQWAFIAFGSGDYANPTESAVEVFHYGIITSGYLAHFAQPGSGSGLRLREIAADRASSSLTTAALAAADTEDFAVRKFSYTSGGVLKATVGNSTVTTTDATFLAGDKTVLIGQGQRDTDIGATQTIDWVVVRPYDGVDPTVTVEEVSSLSSPPHDTMTGLTDDDHTQYVLESIVAAKGDLIVATADNTPGVLTVGANGTVLTANSGEATGLEWA
jgi:hypothetical protein